MHLHPQDGLKSTHQLNAQINRTLLKIHEAVGNSRDEFCESLGLKSAEYTKLTHGKAKISAVKLEAACRHYGISLMHFYSGSIDYVALRKQYHGEISLPERYSDPLHQLSRMRSVKGILNYTHLFMGEGYSDEVLRRLQLRPVYVYAPDDFISMNLTSDLLNELSKDGMTDEQLTCTGTMTFPVNAQTSLGQELSLLKNTFELWTALHEELIHHFDHVFQYKMLALTKRSVSSEITVRPESKDRFQSHVVGNRAVCLFKQGVYSSFLGFMQMEFAEVSETECMYKGDDRCVYHLQW